MNNNGNRFERRLGRWSEIRTLGLDRDQLYPPPSQIQAGHFLFGGGALTIDKRTPVGSMGSCFARKIKEWLEESGFNYLVSSSLHDRQHGSADWERVYNTHCVLQEVSRLVDGVEMPLFELPDGRFLDPWRKNKVFETRGDAEDNVGAYLKDGVQVLTEMEVFVITLGLSEVWFDNHTGYAFSEFPKFPELFPAERRHLEFVDSSASLRNLQAAVALLHKINSDMQIIVTVSPVPLRATFFNRSIFASNSLSKAALLQAAIELSLANPNVHYFPSYEIALFLGQGPTFEWDGRHVTDDTVRLIMAYFEEVFVS